ncbi:MAG: hypothetical protein ABSA52_22395 [Candidatus Binatia bacterium]|jgi:hypothetical protein
MKWFTLHAFPLPLAQNARHPSQILGEALAFDEGRFLSAGEHVQRLFPSARSLTFHVERARLAGKRSGTPHEVSGAQR